MSVDKRATRTTERVEWGLLAPEPMRHCPRSAGVVAAALFALAERVETETGLAAASLRAAAQDATTTSQQSVAQSVEQAGRAAAAAVGEPVRRAETALNANTARLDEAVRRLDGRLVALRRLHTGNSWIALAAIALMIVVAVAVAVYAGAQVRDDLVQVGWVDGVDPVRPDTRRVAIGL